MSGILFIVVSGFKYITNATVFLQEKYESAIASLAEMEKRVVMAESMLEATMQYQSGQHKAQPSPRYLLYRADMRLYFYVDKIIKLILLLVQGIYSYLTDI